MDESQSTSGPELSAIRRTMFLMSAVSISILTLLITIRLAVRPGLELSQAAQFLPDSGHGTLNTLIASAVAMFLGSLSVATDTVAETRASAAAIVGPLVATVYLAVAVSLALNRRDGWLTSFIFFVGFGYFVWLSANLINRGPVKAAPITPTTPHASLRIRHRTRRGLRELARNAASCVAFAVSVEVGLSASRVAHDRGIALLLNCLTTAGIALAALGYTVMAAVVVIHAKSIRSELVRRVVSGAVLAPAIWVCIDTIDVVIAARLSLLGSLGVGVLVASLTVPAIAVGRRWVSYAAQHRDRPLPVRGIAVHVLEMRLRRPHNLDPRTPDSSSPSVPSIPSLEIDETVGEGVFAPVTR